MSECKRSEEIDHWIADHMPLRSPQPAQAPCEHMTCEEVNTLVFERDQLREEKRELVEALTHLLDMTDHFPECNEFRGGYRPFSKKTARDLLARVNAKETI